MMAENTTAENNTTDEPKLDPRYRTGNVEILSSDNVLFKVHQYQLMAAGAGFRDAMTGPKAAQVADGEDLPIRLELVDDDFETSKVVASFLHFLLNGTFTMSERADAVAMRDALRFARKWQCTTTVRLLLDLSRLALLSQEVDKGAISPEQFFALGAEHEDIALCMLAIERAGRWQWADNADYAGGSRTGCSVMDPTAWDEDQFDTNPRYYWALTVATNKELSPSQTDTGRWKRIADKFGVAVKSKKRSAKSSARGRNLADVQRRKLVCL